MEERQHVQVMMQDVCDATFPQGAVITGRQPHPQISLDQLLWNCAYSLPCKITLIQTENLISIAKIFANNSKVYFWATIHYATLNMIITLVIRNYVFTVSIATDT